jgi:uncharacterized membrane protein YuzA (DUF378 family)
MAAQPRGLKITVNANDNKNVKNPLWAGLEIFLLSLLVVGGVNWGVTALRLLTDKHRVCPHDLLQLMRSPWWLQFIVYLLVFIATLLAVIHLAVNKIHKLNLDDTKFLGEYP